MEGGYSCVGLGFKLVIILLGVTLFVNGKKILPGVGKIALESIKSEDGDIIDCIDIYNQPAFDHPALRNHTIQMAPTTEKFSTRMLNKKKEQSSLISQLWQKSGSCPRGTVPVRRFRNQDNNGRKKPIDMGKLYLQEKNHSKVILITLGYSYSGVKGEIKVWNPNLESDDEYSISQISLKSGPYYNYETVQSGWAVNPSVYGDRKTRLFIYWTVDASKTTGCFDLTCPGFIQTSNQIALGASIYPISTPYGLPFQITLYIFQDPSTSNWWVQYGEKINIGYWPAELFDLLRYHAECAEWGGEVYSSKLGQSPHTSTGMGNGHFPDYVSGNSGSIKRMRIRDNSLILKIPAWAYCYVDEYCCYNGDYIREYVEDPEFYYGGPGRNSMCP